jgi:hypothetical protein
MARRFNRFRFTSALTIIIVLGSAAVASATGYWNMPGTFCQWSGHGYGGGYHAPLVLGPVTYECLSTPNDVRLPCAPNPYACAPYYGNGGGCGCGGSQPTMMSPSVQPVPARQVMPETTRRSTLFTAPVQR